ncbi:hypothetical protein LTR85_010848 [Meristemomyces frigidus]|nr:hypothetical protein LTR85_010848 [Meristemomyces frigidus]
MRINPSSYDLAHTNADCKCDLVSVNPESIANVLRSGHLPLLKISRDSSGGAIFSARSYVRGEDFVALSHVWAEGLGNPHDNALHACELERLFRLTSSIYTDVPDLPIWIDSICVPVRPKDLHQLAMAKMREPYRLASCVLVLDAYLLGVHSSKIDSPEMFARIMCSTWMQRLWTLQEGRLAREVYFQFADRAVSLREQFNNTSFRRIPSQVYRSVQLDLIFMYEGSHFTDRLPSFNGSITSTRRAIKTRSVSVSSDEALCVACLLDMELEDIVNAPAEERMAVLWRKVKQVPVGLAFSKAERKLGYPGLHWAPNSFLGLTSLLGSHEDTWYGTPKWALQLTTASPGVGLLACVPGAFLHPGLYQIDERFAPEFDDSKRLGVHGNLVLRNAQGTWYILARKDPWTDQARASDLTRLRRAIFLEQSMTKDIDSYSISPKSKSHGGFGLVHDIAGVTAVVHSVGEKGILHVEGLHHVALIRFEEGYQRAYETAFKVAQQMLAETQQLWWRLDDRAEQRCRAKAAELFKESDGVRELYEDWVAHEELPKPAFTYFGDFIAAFGALGDLLTIEALPDDQEWCID